MLFPFHLLDLAFGKNYNDQMIFALDALR